MESRFVRLFVVALLLFCGTTSANAETLISPFPSPDRDISPSALITLYLPSRWEAAYHPLYIGSFPNGESVKNWESRNFNIIIDENKGISGFQGAGFYGVKYFHKDLRFEPREFESLTREEILREAGSDSEYENLFLHVTKDTYINPLSSSGYQPQSKVSWDGIPLVSGWVTRATTLRRITWLVDGEVTPAADIFDGDPAEGGAFYVSYPEKFNELQLTLGRTGAGCSIQWEYPTGIDPTTLQVVAWGALTLSQDTTFNFSSSGLIRFTPPSNWKITKPNLPLDGISHHSIDNRLTYLIRAKKTQECTTRPLLSTIRLPKWNQLISAASLGAVHSGGVPRSSNDALRVLLAMNASPYPNTYRGFDLKIASGEGSGQTRKITSSYSYIDGNGDVVKTAVLDEPLNNLPDESSIYEIVGGADTQVYYIPGFNPIHDLNGNGYIEPGEAASRGSVNSSATFRYQSRLVALARRFDERTSGALPDLTSAQVRRRFVDYLTSQTDHYSALMYDDLRKILGEELGIINSSGTRVGVADIESQEANLLYQQGTLSLLDSFRYVMGNGTIGANIVSNNPLDDTTFSRAYQNLLSGINWYYGEAILSSGHTIGGSRGLASKWHIPALAARNIFGVLNVSMKGSAVERLGNTSENWEQDKLTALTLFYLMQSVNDLSHLNSLSLSSASYYTSSRNTQNSNSSGAAYFWAEGIPVNVAYRPEALALDIGKPNGVVPAGHSVFSLGRWNSSAAMLEVLANSKDSILYHPQNGAIPIIPSGIFHLSPSDASPCPEDTFIARGYGGSEVVQGEGWPEYLAIYRTSCMREDGAFISGGRELSLPIPYARLKGSQFQEYSTRHLLKGFEGTILKIDTTDEDGDGHLDRVDECPADPRKSSPGVCGCGVADRDENGNGVPDCSEDFSPSPTPTVSPTGIASPIIPIPVQTPEVSVTPKAPKIKIRYSTAKKAMVQIGFSRENIPSNQDVEAFELHVMRRSTQRVRIIASAAEANAVNLRPILKITTARRSISRKLPSGHYTAFYHFVGPSWRSLAGQAKTFRVRKVKASAR